MLRLVADDHAIGQPVDCALLRPSWNDTYRVRTTEGCFILRVYGADWHTLPEIEYELDLLLHLARREVSVSVPIARMDGHLLTALPAAEGPRHAALFTYAPGRVPAAHPLGDHAQSRRFGASLAALHAVAATFHSPHTRSPRDLAYYLDRPLDAIHPFLAHRPDDWAELQRLADEIRMRLGRLTGQGLEWGIVHGDPFSANATITDEDVVTWFDFDLCGPGWPSGELGRALFLSREHDDADLWHAFLDGYRARRPLTPAEFAAVPILLTADWIWSLAINIAKGPRQGFEWLDDDNITKRLGYIQQSALLMRGE